MTYLTRPVFEFPVNWSDLPGKQFLFDLTKVELGFGAAYFAPLQQRVVQGFDFDVFLTSAAQLMEFDAFMDALVGRLNGFWLPAPFLTLQITGGVSSTQFDIVDQGLRNTLALHPDVHLWLRRPGLAARACKISAVALQSTGIERVTLTTALATPASVEDSASRLHYVRLAADIERGRFPADNKMQREVRVVELPHEYTDYETGTRPIFLYHLWADVPMNQHWYYTSFAAAVVSDNIQHLAFPMQHGQLKKSMRAEKESLEIAARFDAAHPFSLFLPLPFSRPLNVEVSQCSYADPDDAELIFTGTVRRVNDETASIRAEVNSWTNILARKVPPMLIQEDDNYEIFDTVTGATPRWRFELACEVVSVDPAALPPTITLDFGFPTSAQYPNWITQDWFAGGHIECGQGVEFAVRSILSSVAIGSGTPKQLQIELNAPATPTVGSIITLTPGYDGSYETRRDIYKDEDNFGGFIDIPEGNPALNAMDSNVSQGGKK